MRVDVTLCELEPGNHISRKIVRRIETKVYEIPDAARAEIGCTTYVDGRRIISGPLE